MHQDSGQIRLRVDIVGPSNLFTLLQTIPALLGKRRAAQGGVALTYVDAIKKPLLIGQGTNDLRVNVRESDQIVAAMKTKGIPVTYVLFPDEGHGFA